MPELAVGGTYDLTVKRINDDGEPFPSKSDASKTMYPHAFLLIDDEGNEYNTQICDTSQKQNYADEGDLISVTVNKLSLNLYSVKYVKTISKAQKVKHNTNTPFNPIMGGSAAAIAMNLSIEHFKFHDENETDTVYTRADGIFEWLKDHA